MKTRLSIIIGIIIIAALVTCAISSLKEKNRFLNKQTSPKSILSKPEILNQAVQQEASGDYLQARSLYEKLINDFPNSPQVGDWQEKVWDFNIKLLFSSVITEGSILYEIKSGDTLDKIAKKFNTTIYLLKKSNALSNDKILAGGTLKVWTRPFNIVVDKSQNILMLKSNDKIIKTYIVATGINNSTPVGRFTIIIKLINPHWFKGGTVVPPESPDNILGSRWMGFDLDDYGIHGTNDAKSLGQQITQGCVRMSNSDVEELFAIVPTGTEVTIVD